MRWKWTVAYFVFGACIRAYTVWSTMDSDAALLHGGRSLCGIWLGIQLANSWMSSFMKFQSAVIPRPLILDVGRIFFETGQSMELGICLALWSWRLTSVGPVGFWRVLSGLALILAIQCGGILPILSWKGKQRVLVFLEEHGAWQGVPTEKRWEQFRKDVAKRSNHEVTTLHSLFVFLEVVKVMLLLYLLLEVFK